MQEADAMNARLPVRSDTTSPFEALALTAKASGFVAAELIDALAPDTPTVASNLPDGFDESYRSARIPDPLVHHARSTARRFAGLAYLRTVAPAIRKLGRPRITAMQEHGYSEMLAIPVHRRTERGTSCHFAGFYWNGDEGSFLKTVRSQGRQLHLAAVGVMMRGNATDALDAPDASTDDILSQRERECLGWCAIGKTAAETAAIIGLSETTVTFHMTKAVEKLGARSRTHAVALAVSMGLVHA